MNAIVCVDINGGIGFDKDLLFHFSKDMKRFKALTENNIVVMGRKTFETFPGPLKNRVNVVLTRQDDYPNKDGLIIPIKENQLEITLADLLSLPEHKDKQIWVIGGAEIYQMLKGKINRWEITFVPEAATANIYMTDLIKDIRCNYEITGREEVTDLDKKTQLEKTFYFETYATN